MNVSISPSATVGAGRFIAGDDPCGAGRGLEHDKAEGLVRPGIHHAGGLAVEPGQFDAVADERAEPHAFGESQVLGARDQRVACRAVTDDEGGSCRVEHQRGGEQVLNPLLMREPATGITAYSHR